VNWGGFLLLPGVKAVRMLSEAHPVARSVSLWLWEVTTGSLPSHSHSCGLALRIPEGADGTAVSGTSPSSHHPYSIPQNRQDGDIFHDYWFYYLFQLTY
jgi:hypothetical protein